jgi:serine/threonine protein kinase
VRRVLSAGKDSKVEIKGIGGVLNDVYLIRTFSNGEERKAVVKEFKDWSSFKWFPLTLWTIGARSFAVVGRSRLEKECAINEFLVSKGFNVPKVLCISHDERLIFTEYIEGEGLDKIVKRIGRLKNEIEAEKDLQLVAEVGETMAMVHSSDVSLGDTKPENIMVGKDGKMCSSDLTSRPYMGTPQQSASQKLSSRDISRLAETLTS